MEFLIISGMSGAGKSMAADILEDMDYYCVDNMPVALLSRFAELCIATGGRYERVALVTDVRERESIPGLIDALDKLWEQGLEYRILYVEADTPTIVRRYQKLAAASPHARRRFDRRRGDARGGAAGPSEGARRLHHQYDGPDDCDAAGPDSGHTAGWTCGPAAHGDGDGLRLQVRTADGRGPGVRREVFAEPVLRRGTSVDVGLDKPVSDFVFSCGDARRFLEMLVSMLKFLMPLYLEEGKYNLNIAIGCTGGRHRSVAVTNAAGGQALGAGFPDCEELQGSREGMSG